MVGQALERLGKAGHRCVGLGGVGQGDPRQMVQKLIPSLATAFRTNDWVAQKNMSQPNIGVVKQIWDDGTFDLVLYDHNGIQIGRKSPPEGGPTKYEPCCPMANYKRIQPPVFPLRRNLSGDWSPWLKGL